MQPRTRTCQPADNYMKCDRDPGRLLAQLESVEAFAPGTGVGVATNDFDQKPPVGLADEADMLQSGARILIIRFISWHNLLA